MAAAISINAHSSIRIAFDKVIYFDPFHIPESSHDADIIFVTHDHFDHYSPEDIAKIAKPETLLVAPLSTKPNVSAGSIAPDHLLFVEPGKKYQIGGIDFEAVPAYNPEKPFHPQANQWVGYLVNVEDQRIFVCGDTDPNEDNKKVQCDVLLVPVGGKYTMNTEEAAAFANTLRPKLAIPTHYGDITGTPEDGEDFAKRLENGIEAQILISC